ncbi:hypothetical protein IMZ11_12235 [Microtetraspora sp. AC03309]|uniref:hypothetical protein n=1 Tax=Microtetraspora sp. AC03309 TaxID=2779376 RepID=UPI001E36C18C|nr:hypothetical protein [Microtetraspora sp. AC03309]MCC5576401.1 hypothetical protein [Microtetraspora sp. AC03309]
MDAERVPFEELADALIEALEDASAALSRVLETGGWPQKVLANRKVADQGTVSKWLSGGEQLSKGNKLPGADVMHKIIKALDLSSAEAEELLALGRRIDALRERMQAMERAWRIRASNRYAARARESAFAMGPAGTARGATGEERAAPWRKKALLFGASGAAAVAVSWVIWQLWPPTGKPSVPTALSGAAVSVIASPTSAPPDVVPEYGMHLVTKSMAVRLPSRSWTQNASGDIEIWENKTCPPGVAAYWIALRPKGETVRFACNSWQYHKWTGVPAGTHFLEAWKADDGLAITGESVVRSSVPIIEHPKSPAPSP